MHLFFIFLVLLIENIKSGTYDRIVFPKLGLDYDENDLVTFDYRTAEYLPESELEYWDHQPLEYDVKIILGTIDPIYNFVEFIKKNKLKNTVFLSFNVRIIHLLFI